MKDEKLFTTIISQSREAITIADLDGNYIYVNPAFCKMMGYSEEELLQMTVFDVKAKEQDHSSFETSKTTKEGVTIQVVLARKDGTEIVTEVLGSMIDFDGKQIVLGTVHDITQRKRTEDALIEANKIINRSPAVTFLWKNEEGWPIEFVSENAADIFGYSAHELIEIQRTYLELIYADDQERVIEEVVRESKAAKSKKFVHTPYRIISKSGEIKWIDDHTHIRRNSQGVVTHYEGIILDITDRKRAEEKSNKTSRLYKTFSRINHEIIRRQDKQELFQALCDVLVDFGKFRLAWVGCTDEENKFVVPVAFSGESADYLQNIKISLTDDSIGSGPTGRSIREGKYVVCNDLENHPDFAHWREAAMEKGYRSSGAFPLKFYDNIIGALNVYAVESHFFDEDESQLLEEIALSISFALEKIDEEERRKQAEKELAAQKEGLANIIQGTNAGTWEWNIQTDELILNERWAEIMGYTLEELTPINIQTWRKNVHPEDLPATNAAVENHFSGELDYYDTEFRQSHKNGNWVWIRARGKIVEWDENDKPLRMSGTHLNITERKMAEQNILLLNQELEQRVQERTAELSDSIEQLESFSYSISHDLRAPLRAINGFSEILMTDFAKDLDDEIIDYLSKMNVASQNMDNLIIGLLTLSQLSLKELTPTSLRLDDLATQVFNTLKTTKNEREISFQAHTSTQIVADHNLIKILLINLISNSIKFTQKEPVALIEFGCINENGSATFFLRDNGIGFSMDYADKIFGPFQRLHTHDEFEGTGIGLAIAYRIINNHHGKIWAESEEGAGTTIFFTIGSLED